jgi:hypothetical protein
MTPKWKQHCSKDVGIHLPDYKCHNANDQHLNSYHPKNLKIHTRIMLPIPLNLYNT